MCWAINGNSEFNIYRYKFFSSVETKCDWALNMKQKERGIE